MVATLIQLNTINVSSCCRSHTWRLGMMQGRYYYLHLESGNSPEIKLLVPLLKRFGYADCYYKHDFFSKGADHVLNTTVNQEAYQSCSTSSTTAQLVMGDALAV
jgi:arabinose-5-phosphate isomerase